MGNIMTLQKIPTRVIIAIIAAGILLIVTTSGLLSVNQAIPSSGNVTTVNVGVYADSTCTQNLSSISWGDIFPGDSVTRTIYVKNTGNTQITLSMAKTNWNPSNADGPITLTWDKEGTTLNANEVTAARLTLSVSEDISEITNFSVDIVITGTG